MTDLAKIQIHTNTCKDVKSPFEKRDENGVFVPLDFIPIKVEKTIDGIIIHNEKVKCFNANGIEQFELDNTRAIIISLGDSFLHIEKQRSWSEFWDISMKETEIPEKSSEWENDEDSSYEVHSYSQSL